MNTNLKRNTTFAALALLVIVACKPMSQTDLKGVDAVTSGDVNAEEQGPCGKVSGDGKSESPEAVVQRVFAALPESLQTFYGGKAMDTVTLTDDIHGACSKALENEQQKDDLLKRAEAVGSCFSKKTVNIGAQQTVRPHVIMKKDAKIINGSLLSNYVFIFLSAAVDGALSKETSDENIVALVAFITGHRAALASSVVSDLKGEMVDEKKSVIDALKSAFAPGSEDLAKSPVFQNFLIGEFAESYYCSAKTFQHLKNPSFKTPGKKWSEKTMQNLQDIFDMFGNQRF